ncbi:MAG TPA: hypothetical protein VMY98_05305 [Anaerolineae bacterium]|nr:hypothetical protein [Anaerolineae bacterium]
MTLKDFFNQAVQYVPVTAGKGLDEAGDVLLCPVRAASPRPIEQLNDQAGTNGPPPSVASVLSS